MNTVSLSLDEIYQLANKTLLANGCDQENANILSETIMKAERDGSLSHGLFRLPAYVSGLKSGKINGKGKPEINAVAREELRSQLARSYLDNALGKTNLDLFNPTMFNGKAFRNHIHKLGTTGKELFGECKPLKIDQKVLTVAVNNPQWRQALIYNFQSRQHKKSFSMQQIFF